MIVRFHPDSDREALVAATAEYAALWEEWGARIVAALEDAAGLSFAERFINAIVFEGISGSHPLAFRASYDREAKLSAIAHELAHRLLAGNRRRLGLGPYQPGRDREEHELIDLFLYDAWCDLWGEEFAQRQVAVESGYRSFYREAWEATLALDRAGRVARLAGVRQGV